jgi:hypothetical protein
VPYALHVDGRVDVLDIVIHQNVCLSQAIVTNILDSDHIPGMLIILDHVRLREALEPDEKLTDRAVSNLCL